MDITTSALEYFDFRLLLHSFYLFSASAILLVYFIAPFRKRFLQYGARSVAEASPTTSKHEILESTRLLDSIAALRVSHDWFLHFYVVSTALSGYWAHQLLTGGPILQFISAHTRPATQPSMTEIQTCLCCTLLAIQGLRRLIECIAITKPNSNSTMWIGHYFAGLTFYIAISISVWIEGISGIKKWHSSHELSCSPSKSLPSSALICIPLFLAASYVQNRAHAYLASLQKYTLPETGVFRYIVAPHYTAECLIYLSLTILAAPPGQIVNKSLLSALAFVVVNLGVSADVSRDWMARKFGREEAAKRWRMIPVLF